MSSKTEDHWHPLTRGSPHKATWPDFLVERDVLYWNHYESHKKTNFSSWKTSVSSAEAYSSEFSTPSRK